jgi:hypothetical protein
LGGFFWRLYRVRALSAVFLCLPAVLLCAWYGWNAFSRFDRYRRYVEQSVPFTAEEFHIQLFDLLRRDLANTLMGSAPARSKIARFRFRIGSRNMDVLLQSRELETRRPYVSARLERGRSLQPLQMRLRGQRHWHLLTRKKSLKVKLPRGALLDGHRVFNLMNDPSPMVMGEEIILDLAREMGVLTPHSHFARVQINGADLGIFHYETQPDESLLRVNQRVPGNMYSGNLPPSAKTEELWNGVERWKNVAYRSEQQKGDFSDLERLLDKIRSSSIADFADFARRQIDLDAFATFDALNVAFGSDERDYRENHKLFFDPYRGRWEPVAWNFRGFRNEPAFNLVENPILLRLKLVPEYLSLRNRALYEFLMEQGSVSAVRARGWKMLRKLAPDLGTDSNWTAYQLLSGVDRFHRQMLRPMNMQRAALVFESEMTTYRHRRDYLVRVLQKNPLWIRMGEKTATSTRFQLIVDGETGVELTGFHAQWPEGCAEGGWKVVKDEAALSETSTYGEAEMSRPVRLYPAVRLVEREDASRARGKVRTETVPETYSFLLESPCVPLRFQAEAVHLATGSRVRSRPAGPEQISRPGRIRLAPEQVPKLEPGEISAHAGQLRRPPAESVTLGPGDLPVERTRVFPENQSVTVQPGTRFMMGPAASLVFRGQVRFLGTRQQPIVIQSASEKRWGGVAVQGPSTAGSSLSYLEATGGTKPEGLDIPYPGMINLHDTADVTVRHCRFGDNRSSDDALHAAYVDDLTIEDTEVRDVHSDAVDLEFVRAKLSRVTLASAGDDGLDLMGSRVKLRDSAIVSCRNNGISCGEETRLRARSSLVAGCRVAVLAKNASTADLAGSLLYGNRTGVEVYSRTVRFAGDSQVNADVLFAVESKRAVKRKDRKSDSLDQGRVQTRLPRGGVLDHLMQDVLGLSSWKQLPGLVKSLGGGGR